MCQNEPRPSSTRLRLLQVQRPRRDVLRLLLCEPQQAGPVRLHRAEQRQILYQRVGSGHAVHQFQNRQLNVPVREKGTGRNGAGEWNLVPHVEQQLFLIHNLDLFPRLVAAGKDKRRDAQRHHRVVRKLS